MPRLRRRSWLAALGLLAAVGLLAAACTGSQPAADPAVPAGSTTTEPTTPDPTTPPSPSDTEPARVLEDRYYTDSDGNAIPDFIEVQLGLDPTVDDCLQDACPGVGDLADLNVLDQEQNTLLILDSSGSMAGDDGTGRAKIDAAKDAITRYVVGTPDSFNLGLMVYGHQGSNNDADKPASCAGIDVFAPLGQLTADTVDGQLARFSPTGFTPIAGSLQAAAGVFAGREGAANRVILVTDGLETCDGDPVAAATALSQAGIAVTVDVVGFDIEDADAAALRAIADATGGTYTNARTGADLTDYFRSLIDRQVATVRALNCLLMAQVRSVNCTEANALDAAALIDREARTEQDGERRTELHRLQRSMIDYRADYLAQFEETMGPLVERLEAQLEAVRERYRERFGEELSGLDCPVPVPSAITLGVTIA